MKEFDMDLLLWRHAEAVDGAPDEHRKLTPRGHVQARRVAAWLTHNQPEKLRVLASPTMRTRQTAQAFREDFEILHALAPGASARDILTAAGWPDGGGNCLIVGHQPTLGRLAALLLSGAEENWTVRKGALWWFSRRIRNGDAQTLLHAVVPPSLI
jgi:phosphohistidine phosphatase